MQIRSYISSWYVYEIGEANDATAYVRFMDWMQHPNLVKPRGWNPRKYIREFFEEDVAEMSAAGLLEVKHPRGQSSSLTVH